MTQKTSHFRLLIWAAAVLFSLGSTGLAQTTRFVAANATAPGTGTSAQPFVLIQDAINASTSGDTVLVRPGVYHENIDFAGKNISLISTAGAGATTIDGGGAFMVVRFVTGETSAALIRGFTLRNGAAIDGAGILCVSTSPRIESCIVTQNVAVNDGGGIHAYNATPTITECSITQNSSGIRGGGMTAVFGANVTITRCTFDSNASPFGGGLAVISAAATIEGATITGNTATTNDGGGLHSDNSNVTVRGTEIRDNTGGYGGGVSVTGGTAAIERSRIVHNSAAGSGAGLSLGFCAATVTGSLIANNTSSVFGGGLYATSATVVVTNATITGNSSAFGGGAILVGFPPNLTVTNSILWGDLPDEVGASFGGATVTVSYSDIQGGYAGTANIAANPLFANAANLDFDLAAGSPCLNNANPAALAGAVRDLLGRPRTTGAGPDRGAYEFAPVLAGSNEDLSLVTTVNGEGADVTTHYAAGLDVLRFAMSTPGGTFSTAAPILVGEIFTAGAPPIGPGGFPAVHVSATGAQILFDGNAGIFGVVALAPTPLTLVSTVYPGLTGLVGRVQLLAVSPLAANGFFAISDAHDFVF